MSGPPISCAVASALKGLKTNYSQNRGFYKASSPPHGLKPLKGGFEPLRKTRVLQIVGWSRLAPQGAKRAHTGLRPPILGAAAPQLSCPPASWVASGPLRRPRVRRAGACTARTRSRTGAAASSRGRLPGREMQSASRPGSGSGLSSPSRRLWPPQAAASLSAPRFLPSWAGQPGGFAKPNPPEPARLPL